MRRKLITSLLIFVLIFSAAAGFSASQNVNAADTTVYVTISNAGELVAAHAAITVTDFDNDGKLTVNDALALAHKELHADKEAAFGSAVTEYGLSLTKLWGIETTFVGYYLNNNMCMSLADEIHSGDTLVAWIYKDTDAWSDQYTFFTADALTAEAGKPVTVTLNGLSYDANWSLVAGPVAGASILVDGVDTGVKTDAEGKAAITLANAGNAIISAKSDTVIVPPVCAATVTAAAAPGTGVSDVLNIVLIVVAAVFGAAAFMFGFKKIKK